MPWIDLARLRSREPGTPARVGRVLPCETSLCYWLCSELQPLIDRHLEVLAERRLDTFCRHEGRHGRDHCSGIRHDVSRGGGAIIRRVSATHAGLWMASLDCRLTEVISNSWV